MARKIRPVLTEILAAIDGIEHSVAGRTLDDFQQNWLLKHGIQRGIEIISEASRHLPDELRNTRPKFLGSGLRASAACFGTNIIALLM